MLIYLKEYKNIKRIFTLYSIFYEPPEFYLNVTHLNESDKGGVAVATGWKVTKLDVVNKTAILDDDHEITYDKCLIATGKLIVNKKTKF